MKYFLSTIFTFLFFTGVVSADTYLTDFNYYYDTGNTFPTINSCTGFAYKPTQSVHISEVTIYKNNTGTGYLQLFVATTTGTTAFTAPQATSSLQYATSTSNIPITFQMNFDIASGTKTYFCIKASSVSGTMRLPGSTTFYNSNWIVGHATNLDQTATPMHRLLGYTNYTCPTCPQATTTIPIITDCSAMKYSTDLTYVTSCEQQVDSVSGTTTSVNYVTTQIPFLFFVIFILPLVYFFVRVIIEIVIRFRKSSV